ncbi:MAG TPA: hypothetical protein VH912_16470 [Streptosporangiaceae bacterium]|jgi:hypothetical protein
MLLAVIVACEIGFWVFLLAGLAARYLLRWPRASVALLSCAPLVDLVLLVVATLDLRDGGRATVAHSLAAVYIGVSVGFGHRMITWADQRFAHRFAAGPTPAPRPRYGAAHAARERSTWYRHLMAWAVGCALLASAVVIIGDSSRTVALWQVAVLWTVVLAIDFAISFSFTLFPRRPRAQT